MASMGGVSEYHILFVGVLILYLTRFFRRFLALKALIKLYWRYLTFMFSIIF